MTKPAFSLSDVLAAAENLSHEEQEALADALNQRVAERQRDEMNLAVLIACQAPPQEAPSPLDQMDQMDQAYRAGCHVLEDDSSPDPDPEDLMWGILA